MDCLLSRHQYGERKGILKRSIQNTEVNTRICNIMPCWQNLRALSNSLGMAVAKGQNATKGVICCVQYNHINAFGTAKRDNSEII